MSGLSRFLSEEDILLDVLATNKQQVFEEIGAHMQRTHGKSASDVSTALERRERIGSTALGHGVAIPHCRVQGLEQIRIVYARLRAGLAFDAPDSRAVTDIVALMVPVPATQEHLDVLALVAALFSEEGFRTALHECVLPRQVRELFVQWPR